MHSEKFDGNKNGEEIQSASKDPILLLDSVNRSIIDIMIDSPQISQVELAKKLKMSQSSIAVRIEKLRSSGLVAATVGINVSKLGLKMARVDIATANTEQVLKWARRCPLFINSTLGIGDKNVSIFLVAEDMEMFQYLVESHVRKIPGVSSVNFSQILRWAKDQYLPLRLDMTKTKTPPCGEEPYCPRCPANPGYDGEIWHEE